MRETSVQELENKVEDCIKNNKKWHYHLLTPTCKFNKQQKYALLFESPENSEILITYSEEPEMEVSKKLAKKLHGDKVMEEQSEKQEPSPEVLTLLVRIKKLIAEGKAWHHHVFFPGCIFNKDRWKWTIALEYKDKDQLL